MLPCFLTTEREREQRDEWGEGTTLNSKMCQYVTGPRLESEVNSKMTYCAVVYKFIVSTRSPTFTRNQIFQVDRRLGLPIVPRVRGWRVPNFEYSRVAWQNIWVNEAAKKNRGGKGLAHPNPSVRNQLHLASCLPFGPLGGIQCREGEEMLRSNVEDWTVDSARGINWRCLWISICSFLLRGPVNKLWAMRDKLIVWDGVTTCLVKVIKVVSITFWGWAQGILLTVPTLCMSKHIAARDQRSSMADDCYEEPKQMH